MAPTDKTRFARTVEALTLEEGSTWVVVDAMAEEFEFSEDGFAHGELSELAVELNAAGIDRSMETLSRFAHAARIINLADARDKPTLKQGTSPNALGILGRGGFTPKDVVAEIKSSRVRISVTRAEALVTSGNSGEPRPPQDKWANVDKLVQAACNKIIAALDAERNGKTEFDNATKVYLHFTAQAMSVSVGNLVDIDREANAGIAAIEEFING